MRSSLRGLSRERRTQISTLPEELELHLRDLSEQDLLELVCCRRSQGTVRFDRGDLDAYMKRARGRQLSS